MRNDYDTIILIFTAIFSLISVCLVGYMLSRDIHSLKINPIIKIGALVTMVGVAFQFLQSSTHFIIGDVPPYTEFPLWLCKDIGAGIWALGTVMQNKRG